MAANRQPILYFVFMILLLCAPVCAQPGYLEGYVKDQDGKGIQNAMVGFDRLDYKFHREVTTNKTGHYQIFTLPNGDYTVTVTIDGVLRDRKDIYHVSSGNDNRPLYFKVKPLEEFSVTVGQSGLSRDEKERIERLRARNKALGEAYGAATEALDASRWEDAIASLNKAAEADESEPAVWLGFGEAYTGLAEERPRESVANYEKAFAAYEKALTLKPDDAGGYNNYALALANAGKLAEAGQKLAKAIELDPAGAGKYHYNLGVLFLNQARGDEATGEFQKAIQADPDYADAQYQYGLAMASKATMDGRGKLTPLPGTVEAFKKYLELKPNGDYAESARQMIVTLGGK